MPPNKGEKHTAIPDDMNKVGDPEVKNDSESVKKNDGCCKSCTNKIILTLENCFARYIYIMCYLAGRLNFLLSRRLEYLHGLPVLIDIFMNASSVATI